MRMLSDTSRLEHVGFKPFVPGIALVCALLVSLLGGVPPAASGYSKTGRMVNGKFYWYFSGNTRNKKAGVKSDPLNVVFLSGNAQYGEHEIVDDILKVNPEYEDHILDSTQWIFFTTARGRHSNFAWNEVDKAIATERAFVGRDHMRLWGDDELANMLGRPHGVFVVAGVHHDSPVISKQNHKVSKDWDYSRRVFTKEMKTGRDHGRCVDAKWRRHPGARGWFGDKSNRDWYHYSSGILARITKQTRQFGCRGF